MKFGKDSDQWPRDSLKRSLLLNFPGCKSPLEALELIKSQRNQTASQSMEEYKSMRQAIIDIELSLNGIDIDFIDSSLRENLRLMPLKCLGDIELWREAWMKAIPRLRKD